MNVSDIAKRLALIVLLLFVIGCGLLLLPLEARSSRAIYCGAVALALTAFLFLAKPRSAWARSAFVFVSAGMALIALAVAAGV